MIYYNQNLSLGLGADTGTTTSRAGKVEQSIQSTTKAAQVQSCNSIAFFCFSAVVPLVRKCGVSGLTTGAFEPFNVHPSVIQTVLRHSKQQTTTRYIHSVTDKQSEAQGLCLDAVKIRKKCPQHLGKCLLRVESWVGRKSTEYVTGPEKNGRPMGTRAPDLYCVKAALLCTANNFEAVEGRLSACKYA